MKKPIKFFSIILVAGLIMSLIGFFAGGELYGSVYGRLEPMSNWQGWRGLPFRSKERSPALPKLGDLSQLNLWREDLPAVDLTEKEISNIHALSLDLGAAECVIQTGDEFALFTSNAKTELDGSTLEISSKDQNGLVRKPRPRVMLILPKGAFYDEIEISAGGSSLILDELSCREFDLDAGAASIEIGTLRAEEMNISLGAGSLQIGLLDSQITEIECAAGSGDFTLAGSVEDYTISGECALGSISVDGKDFLSGVAGSSRTGSGARTVNVEVGVGSVDFLFDS